MKNNYQEKKNHLIIFPGYAYEFDVYPGEGHSNSLITNKSKWKRNTDFQIFSSKTYHRGFAVLGIFLLPREISDKIWGPRHLRVFFCTHAALGNNV